MNESGIAPNTIHSREDFGRALQGLRVRSRVSGREAARRADLPVTTVNCYLLGKNLPQSGGLDGFTRLLTVFGVVDSNEVQEWFDALERVRPKPGPVASGGPVPYRGLESFDENQAEWFFGRADVTGLVLARIHDRASRGKPLFVVGSSGAGKSSVLRAGVLAAIQREGGSSWIALHMTPGKRPCTRLATMVGLSQAEVDTRFDSDDVFLQALTGPVVRSRMAVDDHTDIVVIVDQFEELFGPDVDERERQAFLQAIGALTAPATSRVPVVVLGMRADFYPQATLDPMLATALGDDQVVVGPMTKGELEQAIKGPAHKARLTLEPGLVELILRDLTPATSRAACDSGALPLLSHALRMTWERRERGKLTVEAYQASGGITGAVTQSAETIYASLDETGQACARSLFLRLVHTGEAMLDTRRRLPAAEVDAADVDAAQVLARFVEGRLLTVAEDGVEIAHEALIVAWPRLRSWLDEDRAGHALHRRLGITAMSWATADRDPDQLYRGELLDSICQWLHEADNEALLNGNERAFVAASTARRVQEHRDARRRSRIRRTVSSIIVVLILAAGAATSYAVTLASANSRERDLTQSRDLAAQADRFRHSDVALSAQLSLAAYRISPTPHARASLLDATANPLATRLPGPLQVLQTVAVTPNENFLATAGTSHNIQLWDLRDRGKPRTAGEPVAASDDTIFALAFSSTLLASGGADRAVHLWDVQDPAHPKAVGTPLTGMTNTVYSIAFSPDGGLLAVGSADNTVRLFNVADPGHAVPVGEPISTFHGYVQSVTFSHDGQTLAAGSADRTVRLWNMADRHHPRPLGEPLTGATATVFSVAFSDDNRTLVAGSADKNAYTWDVTDRLQPRQQTTLSGASGRINAVAMAPDGITVAAASSDRSVRLWDRSTGRQIVSLPHPSPVTAVAYLHGGRLLATVAADGTTWLWPIPGGMIGNRSNTVFSLEYADTGSLLVTSAGRTANTMELWDTSDPARPVQKGPALPNPMTGNAFSGAIAVSADNRTLASGMDDGAVVLWDITDPSKPIVLKGPLKAGSKLVQTLSFSRDGRVLAVGGDDRTVTLWDVRTLSLLTTLHGPANSVYSVAFSADGSLLAAGSLDNKVWVWNVTRPEAPEPLPTLTGFGGYVHAVVFSPRGALLAAGSADKTVRMWDLRNPTAPVSTGPPLAGATSYVYSVTFSPDGSTLAAGGYDHTVWTWDVQNPATPRWLATLSAPGDSVFVVDYTPDGHTLVAGTAEKAVRLWETDPERAATRICATVGEHISTEEWARYLPDRPYEPPCK